MMASSTQIFERLRSLTRERTGDADAEVHSITTMPGHAGFSYGFVLQRSDHGSPSGKMVLRLAPPNVQISGPADVVRQARIMASLADTEVPVPPIHWYGNDFEPGRPYLIDGFVDGFKLAESGLPWAHVKRLAVKGVELLATLHRVPWQNRIDAFGPPLALADELARLDRLLDRPTLDPALTARAPSVRERLRSTIPSNTQLGCAHGDFQWANILFRSDGPVALIDWELASIAPTLLDIGWLSFFADQKSFAETDRAPNIYVLPEEIADVYSKAIARPVQRSEANWFRAFAGYRYGVITCFNVMLHRRGKRIDDNWELRAPSAPVMFERALELLSL